MDTTNRPTNRYTIRKVTVPEVFDAPAFAELCREYQQEALRNPDLQGGLPDREGYTRMVDAGMLHPLGVFAGAELVGLCAVLVAPTLHFGASRPIATTETLFVAAAHRAGGAGTALLRAAEAVAVQAGAAGLYVSCPAVGRLARILPGAGYAVTNQVFYRKVQP